MKLFFLSICLFSSVSLWAHPGTGIVQDSKGNIFYTDLEHVWKISKNGKKTIAVRNVHTHELYMDPNDNLFGQHSMYSGEATNQYSYYVWQLGPNGKLDTIIKPTDGFYIDNFSFVGDSAGNKYWIKHWVEDKIMQTSAENKTIELIGGNFKKVQWMHFSKGNLYFVYGDSIMALDVTKRKLSVLAQNIKATSDHYSGLFGLWTDKDGNLYVANFGQRKVQQIGIDGSVIDYWISRDEWMPSGGLFDKNGALWLLLVDRKNNVKVKKVLPQVANSGKSSTFSMQSIFVISSILIGVAAVALLIRDFYKRKRVHLS